jgi:uncharacterized protein YaaR (DUF327 family)
MYESNRESLNQESANVKSERFEDNSLEKTNKENSEIKFFQALQKYKDEHNSANLQKLMVEILDFCRSVYASTQNEAERNIYRSMIQKLNK